jgi:membrane protease YdiL (CAAX protease family)
MSAPNMNAERLSFLKDIIKSLNSVNWKRVLIFFAIATVVSNIFRFNVFELQSELKKVPSWLSILISLVLEGSGVFIAAIISISVLKKRRNTEISLFGTSKSKSLIMALIPIIILTIVGVKNEFSIDSHLYGFIAVSGTLLYCIMEEFGWRGYLQEEFKALKPWTKYLLIGFIWYLWHLSFLTEASIGDNLFFLGMMILGSWGIGQVAESTKSIIASACFHMIIQIMMFNALIKNGIDGTEKTVILGVSIAIWFVIIKKWEKQNTSNQ